MSFWTALITKIVKNTLYHTFQTCLCPGQYGCQGTANNKFLKLMIISGLQKMFSLSGTIKRMGKIFCHMCMKHTSQVHSVKSLWAGFRPGAFWRSLVQSAPIFEPFLCKYYFFNFLVLNIFCGVNFFLGPAVPWSCGLSCFVGLDHIYVNNHKIDKKKGMIKVLILNFFNQQTLQCQWMLANIVYNNTCVI